MPSGIPDPVTSLIMHLTEEQVNITPLCSRVKHITCNETAGGGGVKGIPGDEV